MQLAYRLGNKHLPAYASRFSRHDFTLSQLFACLVLKQFYKLDYRALEGLLEDSPDLLRAVGLSRAPHRSTLCDAFAKLCREEHFSPMLDELASAFEKAGLLKLGTLPVAVDSSMFESRHVSRHFERRREQTSRPRRGTDAYRARIGATVRGLPKLSIAVAAACHLILSATASTGSCSDHMQAEAVIVDAWLRADVRRFVADAGYDAEKTHELVREDLDCDLLVPPVIGSGSGRPPKSYWRRAMFVRLERPTARKQYAQRWQAETAFSMLKRNYGSALRAKSSVRREQELLLNVMTHNIAV